MKLIPNPNSIRLASNRIIKKYWKPEKRKVWKKNKSAEWLKKASFLETDNLQTIDYNNDVTRYLETVDFNNKTRMTYLTDIDKIDFKKISGTQQAAKK